MFNNPSIRIDPLKSNGVFDTDFYESEDYKYEAVVVEKYLLAEGFLDEKRQFSIHLLDREWWVSVN